MKKLPSPSTLTLTQLRNTMFPIRVCTVGGNCFNVSMVLDKFRVYKECNGSTYVAKTLGEAKSYMGCSM